MLISWNCKIQNKRYTNQKGVTKVTMAFDEDNGERSWTHIATKPESEKGMI